MSKFFLIRLLSLKIGEESRDKVLANVAANCSFRGANLWILACAILIASIGLNVNSTAVIIGAMLISPLMGPIVGAGFALAIFDFNLLRRSLRNLAIATIVSLSVSTLYFALTPFKEAQSEIIARTSPNIYDVLIAFVGGLVGVIAITRVEKGNPIPGVAIATALMPPLCTAGFGIATGNFSYSFGALFLFSINAVFICVSTFLVVKTLKYPHVVIVNRKHQRKVTFYITILTFAVILPSIYYAYDLFKKQGFENKIDQFVNTEFVDQGNVLISKRIVTSNQGKVLQLALLKNAYSQGATDTLNDILRTKYGISDLKLEFIRSINPNSQVNQLKLIKNLVAETNALENRVDSITILLRENNLNEIDTVSITNELKAFYPEIKTVKFYIAPAANKSDNELFFIYNTDKKFPNNTDEKIKNWLSIRLNKNSNLISVEQKNYK